MLTLLRRLSLTQWILISMAVGTLVGWAAPETAQQLKPLSTIFLRMAWHLARSGGVLARGVAARFKVCSFAYTIPSGGSPESSMGGAT